MPTSLRKPADLFDRSWDWGVLSAFATDTAPGATLGVMSGRRRQGKSLLLESLCKSAGGFYFMATEATEAESLRSLAAALSDHLRSPAPVHLDDWGQAVDVLLGLATSNPVPVVIDEFPYLCHSSPQLPSVIQRAFGPSRVERKHSRARIILCGSAMSFMGTLLSGSAPLRGRAGLELRVLPFDFRTAAAFWEIDDAALALRVHAIVGGTPAYRNEFVRGDRPAGFEDFDAWVCRTALDPSCPLFREGRYLLAQEADIRDPSLYHSVLAAVAEGNATRGGIANFIGRPSDTLRHPITVLEDSGLLAREPDLLRKGRSTYRITEPVINFHHAIIRPELARLSHPGNAARIWAASQSRWTANVLGPHFEELCRSWTAHFASTRSLRADVLRVGTGTVNDPTERRSFQIDVVGFDAANRPVIVGEAKLGEVMGISHLTRLRHIITLLERSGHDTSETLPVCFSGAGFDADLHAAAKRREVLLVDLDRLYHGR